MHNMLTDSVPLTFASDNKYTQLILWLAVTICRYCVEVAAKCVKNKARYSDHILLDILYYGVLLIVSSAEQLNGWA